MESPNQVKICLIFDFSEFYVVFFVSPFKHKCNVDHITRSLNVALWTPLVLS